MAQRQKSYAREAQRNLRDGRKAAEQARQDQRDAMLTDRATAKKNAKSVVTDGGNRWTRQELTGVK